MSVFSKTILTATKSSVPSAGADNHLGILGSAGVWASVIANTFLPGFTPGQGQLLMSHDNTCSVGGSRNETVIGDEVISIGGNRLEQVFGNESITIAQNRAKNVALNEECTVGVNRLHTVCGDESIVIKGGQEIIIGTLQSLTVGESQTIEVGKEQKVKAGDAIHLSAPKITITATQDLTIKCGGGLINIDASGIITIKGPMVKINC